MFIATTRLPSFIATERLSPFQTTPRLQTLFEDSESFASGAGLLVVTSARGRCEGGRTVSTLERPLVRVLVHVLELVKRFENKNFTAVNLIRLKYLIKYCKLLKSLFIRDVGVI